MTLPEAAVDGSRISAVPSFCDARDPVLHGLLGELDRLLVAEGSLEDAYCETVAFAIGAYLPGKYLRRDAETVRGPRLTAWQLGCIKEFVRSRLAEPISIGAMARLIDVSEGHLHRAFRATTGDTPLTFLNRLRVQRSAELIRTTDLSVAQVALDVGFASPTAFARTFRKARGENPGAYRARVRAGSAFARSDPAR